MGVFASIAICAAVFSGVVAPSDGFSQELLRSRHEAVRPALCVLNYSMEVTNARTGEVNRRDAYALGVLVSPDGLIMGPGHLHVENRRPLNIQVRLDDDTEHLYEATLLKKPDDINVTFLKIEAEDGKPFPYVSFEPDVSLELGEPVALFGLLKESLDYARALQTQRIGAVVEGPRRTYALERSIPFGFVGGPVIDDKGRLVGVSGFDLSQAEGGDLYTRSGHPLVYKTALFQPYIDTPPSEDSSETDRTDAWLGVFTQPLTDDLAAFWELPEEGGIVVSTVIQGSPADRAGLRMGDVILSFDGHAIRAKQDGDVVAFTKIVRDTPLGRPVPVHLLRDGEAMEIALTLLPRPKAGRDANEFEDESLGLNVRELTTDVRIAMNLSDDVEGVIVRRVKSGGAAAIAGIRPGMIVLTVGGRPISTLRDYQEATQAVSAEKADEVVFFCRMGAGTAFFRLEPRWED